MKIVKLRKWGTEKLGNLSSVTQLSVAKTGAKPWKAKEEIHVTSRQETWDHSLPQLILVFPGSGAF